MDYKKLFELLCSGAPESPDSSGGLFHFLGWCWHLVVAIFMAFVDFIEMIFKELF
jgi:hypothetical protein